MINKDNNLNIDILRQQNANIPLKEASSQSEEPHQLGNSKSEGNLHNSASKDNIAMLKKDVENYQLWSVNVAREMKTGNASMTYNSTSLKTCSEISQLRTCQRKDLRSYTKLFADKNVLQLTENVNTIDGKLKDPAAILTLHNSVRKTG